MSEEKLDELLKRQRILEKYMGIVCDGYEANTNNLLWAIASVAISSGLVGYFIRMVLE